MKTKLVEATPESFNKAATLLKQGGVVVLPTDTNYNVFTSIHSAEGVKRIFSMKKRNHLSPLNLCFESSQDITLYGKIPLIIQQFIKTVWPAPISLIVDKLPLVPDYVTCNFPTVALACHKHPVLTQIIKAVSEPIAGTSANLSGTGLVKDVEKVYNHIGSAVDLIINGGELPSKGANTIVDCSFDLPILARAGDFSIEQVKSFIPDLQTNYSEEAYKMLIRSRFFNKESK